MSLKPLGRRLLRIGLEISRLSGLRNGVLELALSRGWFAAGFSRRTNIASDEFIQLFEDGDQFV